MTAYWEKPDWPEQLAKNVENLVPAFKGDWVPLFRAISEQCEITMTEAMLLYMIQRMVWWTEANTRFAEDFAPVVKEMKREIDDLKKGDDWKDLPHE